MPVRRFRSIRETPSPRPAASPTENLRAALELIELCHRLHPIRPHRGVRRYRTVGASQEPPKPGR